MEEYTDPPDMPEDERMAGAELRVVREYLGLTGDWLALHLGVNPRTVRSWEQGRHLIPDGVRLEVEHLEKVTGDIVTTAVAVLAAVWADHPDPVIGVYRTDVDYHAAHPEQPWSAEWHRRVVARVAQDVPALRIEYLPAGASSIVHMTFAGGR